jgi:hypothetical protein
MASVSFSASLTVDGKAHSLSKSYTAGVLIEQEFELAAGAVRSIAIPTNDGTSVKFLYIKAVDSADPTQAAEVSYGTNDAEASDAANGTNWNVVYGLKVAWENVALSTANKLHIYNHGSSRILVELAIGLEGS